MDLSKKEFNPWHIVPIGKAAPKIVNMVVEIPRDSDVKYELDKETGMLRVDRQLYSAVHYPANYGFIPRTLWEDDDPLDIFTVTLRPVYPLSICEARVIGVVHMKDRSENDEKIIAVHTNDPRYSRWHSLDNVPEHFLKELTHFLETYKHLQGAEVKVFEIKGVETAHNVIRKAMKNYEKKFGK